MKLKDVYLGLKTQILGNILVEEIVIENINSTFVVINKKGVIMAENNKRSIATYSSEERIQKLRTTTARVTSSKQAATKFLKKAGILTKNGNLKEVYRSSK